MMVHIDFAAEKNCYALAWSYGEICVGCGCCGKPSLKRDKARYLYWLDQWEENLNFNHWFDDPELRKLQETNRKLNFRYLKSRLNRYKTKVLVNRLVQPDEEKLEVG